MPIPANYEPIDAVTWIKLRRLGFQKRGVKSCGFQGTPANSGPFNSRLYDSNNNDNATRTAICNKDKSYIYARKTAITVATRMLTVALIATVMRT